MLGAAGASIGLVPPGARRVNASLPFMNTDRKDVPTPVKGVSEVQTVAIGGVPTLGAHMLTLLKNGTVLAWGANGSGQLVNGHTSSSLGAVTVSGLSGVTAVSASVAHNLALLSNGTVYA